MATQLVTNPAFTQRQPRPLQTRKDAPTFGSKSACLAFHQGGATHTNLAGADKLAGLVAKAIKDQNIGLAPYLRQ